MVATRIYQALESNTPLFWKNFSLQELSMNPRTLTLSYCKSCSNTTPPALFCRCRKAQRAVLYHNTHRATFLHALYPNTSIGVFPGIDLQHFAQPTEHRATRMSINNIWIGMPESLLALQPRTEIQEWHMLHSHGSTRPPQPLFWSPVPFFTFCKRDSTVWKSSCDDRNLDRIHSMSP